MSKTNPTLPTNTVAEKAEEADLATVEDQFNAVMGDGLPDRKKINEGLPPHDTDVAGRAPIGQPRNLDADPYLQAYPDKKLMWVNQIGGDVDRWLNAGAEPVPRRTASRTFEGLTDQQESKWVRAVGGDDGTGNSFWVYLLMIDPAIYDHVALAPERARQKAIHDAMYAGRDQSDTKSGLQSYAPNLPTGDRGMNVAQEIEQ